MPSLSEALHIVRMEFALLGGKTHLTHCLKEHMHTVTHLIMNGGRFCMSGCYEGLFLPWSYNCCWNYVVALDVALIHINNCKT